MAVLDKRLYQFEQNTSVKRSDILHIAEETGGLDKGMTVENFDKRTSFFSKSNKTANYTILDDDNINLINIGAADLDITFILPVAANNVDRKISFFMGNTYAGGGSLDNARKVILDGNGSELINGKTTVNFYGYGNKITIWCDGSQWFVVGITPNPIGITNTKLSGLGKYQYTEDNELDYTSSIVASTTVTISELPSNTQSFTAAYYLTDASNEARLTYKITSTSTNLLRLTGGEDSPTGTSVNGSTADIRTNVKSFYVFSVGTVGHFYVVGYTVNIID